MITTYLIDFENVHELGMNGLHDLPENSFVYILYTDRVPKISLDWFNGVKAVISSVKVESGSQSLDMHLASFLGFLIGQESSADNQYIIVSQDKDYKSMAQFWCKKTGNEKKVSIQANICGKVIQRSFVNQHGVLAGCIKTILSAQGEDSEEGKMMNISSLCLLLNNEPSYQTEIIRLKMRGKRLLLTFRDIIRIVKRDGVDWVVLPGESKKKSVPEVMKKIICNASTETQEEEPTAAEEDLAEETPENEEASFEIAAANEEFPVEEALEEEKASAEEPSSANDENHEKYQMAYQLLLEKGYDEVLAGDIAKTFAEELEAANPQKSGMYHLFLKKYGRSNGSEYYKVVKTLKP